MANISDVTSLLVDAAGYRKSFIMVSAIKLDIFTILERLAPLSLQGLAAELSISLRSTAKLISGLLALKLVEQVDTAQYRNSATAREYLVRGSRSYLGESIRTLHRLGSSTWAELEHTLTTGEPQARQRTDQANAEFWQDLVTAIRPMSIKAAEAAAELLGHHPMGRILDLGGGSGVFGGSLLARFPEAQVLQVDWAACNRVAEDFNQQYVTEKRFSTCDGDLFVDQLWHSHGPFDLVILSHLLHQESPERIGELMDKISSALRPSGLILINEYVLDEDKSTPPYSLIFDLSMLLQNHGGGAYTLSELRGFLKAIGHDILRVYDELPPATLVLSQAAALTPPWVAMPASFRAQRWQQLSTAERRSLLARLLGAQLRFAAENSPYWRRMLPHALVQGGSCSSELFAELPLISKEALRLIPAEDLVSASAQPFYLVRSSSGTSGMPVPVYWSAGDWQAAIETSVRFIANGEELRGAKIWNGYHQGHVAGPVFDGIIRALGATPIPRHFNHGDREAISAMAHAGVRALVLPPCSAGQKGGSLEDLLAASPHFLRELGIHTLWVSSTELTAELLAEVEELGVKQVVNFYGGSEALPTAISCGVDPLSFHLAEGHVFVEVLGEEGKPVASGERGQIVVSRIGSESGKGIAPLTGTMLFRYQVGDTAEYCTIPCSCGISSPKIRKLQRIATPTEDYHGGCEKWE